LLRALLLFAGLLLAYGPAYRGTPVWDDDHHLTPPALWPWEGLGRIWTDLSATQQYYPLTHSIFWLLHRLWGDWYPGYHILNVLLHGVSALLLLAILRRLDVHGAWLAAGLWAFHPVQVESVAWMSELKNTLSGVFYFSAALAYLEFDRDRRSRIWLRAFLLFLLGLLSKSVIATLPGALLLIIWWKQGGIQWRRDLRPLIPFIIAGIASGLFTSWVERTFVGAQGASFDLTLADRCLIAGHAFWFYLIKLIWPASLVFIYPRWQIDGSSLWQYAFPAAAAATVALLAWGRKRWGAGSLVAILYFIGTLLPALGFFNIYPFRYSFVADHFQYLACAGPLALAAAGVTKLLDHWKQPGRLLLAPFSAALCAQLGILVWQQCSMYSDIETLWRTTIARNPECRMAYNNLANIYLQQQNTAAAIGEFQTALQLFPAYADAEAGLGDAFLQAGRPAEALAAYQKAVSEDPAYPLGHYNYGVALAGQGRTEEAIAQYRETLRLNPRFHAHSNLGTALVQAGHMEEAAAEFREAIRMNPTDAHAHNDLAGSLLLLGRKDEAAAEYREAIRINPAYSDAHYNLGSLLLGRGRAGEAITEFRQALGINPSDADAHYSLGMALSQDGQPGAAIAEMANALALRPADPAIENALAWMLAAAPQPSIRDGARAVQLATRASAASAGRDPAILRTLAAAYAQAGRFAEAAQSAQKALDLAQAQPNAALAAALNREITLYKTGRPFEVAH